MHQIVLYTLTPDIQKRLATCLNSWKSRPKIHNAATVTDVQKLVGRHDINLIVIELSDVETNPLENLKQLSRRYPWLPFIGICNNSIPEETAMEKGAVYCIPTDFDDEELLQTTQNLLEEERWGTIKDIPLHTFLQIIESEQKSCTLEISRDSQKGFLYLKNGTLIDAETSNITGEDAALEILSWPGIQFKMLFFNGQRMLQIRTPLLNLVTTAFQLKSEQEALDASNEYREKHQLPLNHLSTADNEIPVHTGESLMVQIPNIPVTQATMVGMVPGKSFIITNPCPQTDTADMIETDQRILVKFINDGRAWMFKTQLQLRIKQPISILLLEYPDVLHYHELRKAKRTATFVPSTFHFNDGTEIYGALTDLSTAGSLCQVRIKNGFIPPVLEPGTPMLLRCLLPGIKEEQAIDCTVRNTNIIDDRFHIGVQFEKMPSYLSNIITRFLFSQEEIEEEQL